MAKPAESGPAKRIFISYDRTDGLSVAQALRAALDVAGFEAIGEWTPSPAQDRLAALPDELSSADGAVIVISSGALNSVYVSREAAFLRERALKEPEFRVIPLLVGDVSEFDLAASPLGELAEFQMLRGGPTEDMVAAAVGSLTGGATFVAQPPESAAESAAESSSAPSESAAQSPAEPPAMSQSTSTVIFAAGSRAGTSPVDASVVLVAALRYARETSLPGVTSALLNALAGREAGAGDLLDRLDAVVGLSPSEAAEALPVAELTATPPLSRLLARAADYAQQVSGDRQIHLRHLVAATVLADDPPLRPELLAALDVTPGELRQIVREAAQQETSGEPQEAWDALLPAETLHLAGGIDTDRVDPSIGIPLSQDDLGFGVWASMFAAIIADEDTEMPLSIGIFGAWGAGKSYFMGLLRAEIERLTGSPGRIAQIPFNAWHYADSNLWASLGDEIFRQLASPEVSAEETRRRIREKLEKSQAEREQLQARTAQAKQQTARLEKEVREAAADRRIKARDLLTAAGESPELKRQLDQVWRRLGVRDEAEQAEMLAGEVRGIPQDTQALRGLLGQRRTWIMAAICLIALLVTVAAIWIPASWGARLREGGAASTIALVLTFGVTLLGSVTNGLKRLSAVASDLTQRAAKAEEDRTNTKIKAKLAELNQAEADEKVASAQLEQVTERIGELARELADLMPGQRLYTFLAERSASGTYTSQLGLISTIRKDFQTLVKLLDDMRTEGGGKPEQPRIDRIVLYIDDLDRCGPRQVVEVLQAVHLLLAINLFVVVVGVDPRWLTRSLRHQYPSTLDSSPDKRAEERDLAEVTPVDYLEKIFNIPFVLPVIPKGGLEHLMGRLAAKPAEKAAAKAAAEAGATPGLESETPAAAARVASGTGPEATVASEPDPQTAQASTKAATAEAQPLSTDELAFLAKLEPFISTPRDAKRMFNLYRLLRSNPALSAASDFLGGRRLPGQFQAVAMLLAMLTADAHLMHYVLDAPRQLDDSGQKTVVTGGLTSRPPQDDWQSFADDLKPERAEDGWRNQIIGRIPDQEVRRWQLLSDAVATTSAEVSLPDLSVFQHWAPSIRRFSYLLSPLNDPGEAA
jgi:hypothetical protein